MYQEIRDSVSSGFKDFVFQRSASGGRWQHGGNGPKTSMQTYLNGRSVGERERRVPEGFTGSVFFV